MQLKPKPEYEAETERTRPERMDWWRKARFGLFVHWGLYAFIGRNEWVRAIECIPDEEYRALADRFAPKDRPAREWARLAKDAGMQYMVMTSKHHEGYCLWDTAQTDFNSVKRGPGRDLVAEHVEACREFGLKCGLYYSLMDWDHPDGGACAYDPEARRRFVDFTHGCVRELMSNYGPIDILWYDVPQPLQHHEGWESLAMNQMARSLQPHILINNRSRLDEDFSTPEGRVQAAEAGRGWEACMTFNDRSWGWMPSADPDSWSVRDILKMLNTACANGGNLLLNIGPAPDGSAPELAAERLRAVGQWIGRNEEAIYGDVDRTGVGRATACGNFSRKGRRLYFWVHCWPGSEMALGGFETRLERAWFLASGEEIAFEQRGPRIRLHGMPAESPDELVGYTVICLDFAEEPVHRSLPTTPALNQGQLLASPAEA